MGRLIDATTFADLEARRFTLRVSARRRDTKASRNHTKKQHGARPGQSTKNKVGIIYGLEDKLLYRDEVQTRDAGQLRFLSSRDH